MTRKPVDPQAAMADGVSRLLRKFDGLGLKTPTGYSGTPSTGGGGGPIETSILVASASQTVEMKRNADYDSDGVDDDEEVMAAKSDLDARTDWSGRIQLTDGAFDCTGPVDTGKHDLRGAGMYATELTFNDGSTYTTSPTSAILRSTDGTIADLSLVNWLYTGGPNPVYTVYSSGGRLNNISVYHGGGDEITPLHVVGIFEGSADNIRVYGGTYRYGAGGSAIYVVKGTGHDQAAVVNCYVDGQYHNDYGILIAGVGVIVANNKIDRTYSHGIHVAGDHAVVSGNAIIDPSNYGVYLAAVADGGVVVGNSVYGDDGTYESGVYVEAGATGNVVGPNVSSDHTVAAVEDYGTGTVIVGGETVRVPTYATDPVSPVEGDMIINSTDGVAKVFFGGAWHTMTTEATQAPITDPVGVTDSVVTHLDNVRVEITETVGVTDDTSEVLA